MAWSRWQPELKHWGVGGQELLSGRVGSARHPWSGPCYGSGEARVAVGTQARSWAAHSFPGPVRLEKTPELTESKLLRCPLCNSPALPSAVCFYCSRLLLGLGRGWA